MIISLFLINSHFPSAGAEAEQGEFRPYSPLVNKEEDHRPGSQMQERSSIAPVHSYQAKHAPWEAKWQGQCIKYINIELT